MVSDPLVAAVVAAAGHDRNASERRVEEGEGEQPQALGGRRRAVRPQHSVPGRRVRVRVRVRERAHCVRPVGLCPEG